MTPDTPAEQSRPQERLEDSLDSYRHLLSDDIVEDIEVHAQELRESLGLGAESEQAVRARHPERNVFETLVRQRPRTREEAGPWWQDHREEVLLVVAVEGELISRAQERYRSATKRELIRREGSPSIDRLRDVTGGHAYVASVERRATVLASRLNGTSEQQLRAAIGAVKGQIAASGGLDRAPFEAVARRVALQLHINADRDQAFSQSPSSPPAAEAGVGM